MHHATYMIMGKQVKMLTSKEAQMDDARPAKEHGTGNRIFSTGFILSLV